MANKKTIKEALAEEYIRIRKQKIPGYSYNTSLEASVDKAEELVIKHEADPVLWVRAQKQYNQAPDFYPVCLHSRNSYNYYIKFMAATRTDEELLFEVQLGYLLTALRKTARTDVQILADTNIDFMPWFRILMTEHPDDELIATYQKSAKSLMTPALEKVLKKHGVDTNRLWKNI